MNGQLHPNYIKSSNLIFITVGLGVINLFVLHDLLTNGKNITTAVISLLFMAVIGYLVRQGKKWMKDLFLVLTILGLLMMPFIINILLERPLSGIINIAARIMEVWATVLLFKIPSTTNEAAGR